MSLDTSLQAEFDRIYQSNQWNDPETGSGPSSNKIATKRVAPSLVALVDALGVKSVLDVGCGDGNWMPDLPGYVGVDISLEACNRHRIKHPDRDIRISYDEWGEPDLVITRDAMQHLSYKSGQMLMDRIRRTNATWLLAASYMTSVNEDIADGHGYRINMSAPPWDLGEPVCSIFDGWSPWVDGDIWDWRKILGLWRLR